MTFGDYVRCILWMSNVFGMDRHNLCDAESVDMDRWIHVCGNDIADGEPNEMGDAFDRARAAEEREQEENLTGASGAFASAGGGHVPPEQDEGKINKQEKADEEREKEQEKKEKREEEEEEREKQEKEAEREKQQKKQEKQQEKYLQDIARQLEAARTRKEQNDNEERKAKEAKAEEDIKKATARNQAAEHALSKAAAEDKQKLQTDLDQTVDDLKKAEAAEAETRESMETERREQREEEARIKQKNENEKTERQDKRLEASKQKKAEEKRKQEEKTKELRKKQNATKEKKAREKKSEEKVAQQKKEEREHNEAKEKLARRAKDPIGKAIAFANKLSIGGGKSVWVQQQQPTKEQREEARVEMAATNVLLATAKSALEIGDREKVARAASAMMLEASAASHNCYEVRLNMGIAVEASTVPSKKWKLMLQGALLEKVVSNYYQENDIIGKHLSPAEHDWPGEGASFEVCFLAIPKSVRAAMEKDASLKAKSFMTAAK